MAQELKTYRDPKEGPCFREFYEKSEVDAVIAEKDKEIRRLNNALKKERSETIKYMDELCNTKNEIERLTIDKRNYELRADVADATVEKQKAAIAELKAKLESVQASMYADVVDAGMENRSMQRALWIARAKRAIEKIAWFKLWNSSILTMNPEDGARQKFDKWKKNLGKFFNKAEKYK